MKLQRTVLKSPVAKAACGLILLTILLQGFYFSELKDPMKKLKNVLNGAFSVEFKPKTRPRKLISTLKTTHKPRNPSDQISSDLAGKTPHIQMQLAPSIDQIFSTTKTKLDIPFKNSNFVTMRQQVSSSSLKEHSTISVDFLIEDLRKKLEEARDTENVTQTTCKTLDIQYKEPECKPTSENHCPRLFLPVNLRDRIESLVLRENLQVPEKYQEVLKNMSRALPGHYDVILVSAISSNHYKEGQAMLKDLHEKVFPQLRNFTLVIYDLGLDATEKSEVEKYCRCTVLSFPFERFPPHFRTLKCFGWKPTVIRAMYENANFVIWTDTSIRIHNPKAIPEMIERARQRGIQQRHNSLNFRNPFHTLVQMFTHFGDSPCAHISYTQAETGYGIYHREPFVRTAILDPWYGCAVRAECSCPVEQKTVQRCPGTRGLKTLGLCMRNEQSAISVIAAKLFREKYRHFVVNVDWFQSAKRENTYPYFDELKKKEIKDVST